MTDRFDYLLLAATANANKDTNTSVIDLVCNVALRLKSNGRRLAIANANWFLPKAPAPLHN